MTRKEEIELAWFGKAVQSNHRYDEKTFKEAVEWADKTMVEKATQWMQSTLYEVATGLTNRPDVASIESTTMDDFINNFRKAMEE